MAVPAVVMVADMWAKLSIDTELSVSDVDALLHEGRFSPANFHFDSETRQATLLVEQLHPDPARTLVERSTILAWRLTVPVTVLRIVFDAVESATLENLAETDWVEVDDVSFAEDALRIEATPTCVIELRGSAPKVRVEVVGPPVGEKTFYRFGRSRPASL